MAPPLRMHEASLALAGLVLLCDAAGAAPGGHGAHSGGAGLGGHPGWAGGQPGGGRHGPGGGPTVPHVHPGQGRGGGPGHGGHGVRGHGGGWWIAGSGGWYYAPAPVYGYSYGYGYPYVYSYGYAPGVAADPVPPGAVSYCPTLQAYYPDVSDCPGGWLLVVPAPSGY